MRIEYRRINDAGEQVWDKVEWWDKEDFKGRMTRVYTSANPFPEMKMLVLGKPPGSAHLEAEIPVPDDAIVCDLCNEDITEFPCPVWREHALCTGCRRKVNLEKPRD